MVNNIVTPAVKILRLIVVKLRDRHQLHDVDPKLDQVIDPGNDIRPLSQMSARFSQPQILATPLNARIRVDREVPDMQFIDNRFRDRKSWPWSHQRPVLNYHRPAVVGRHAIRIRIKQFPMWIEAWIITRSCVCIIFAELIALQRHFPASIVSALHGDQPRPTSGWRLIQMHCYDRWSRGPDSKFGLLRRVDRSKRKIRSDIISRMS